MKKFFIKVATLALLALAGLSFVLAFAVGAESGLAFGAVIIAAAGCFTLAERLYRKHLASR